MKQAGEIAGDIDVRGFAAYLRRIGLRVDIRRDLDRWAVWGVDEEDGTAVRDEIDRFLSDPRGSKYALRLIDRFRSLCLGDGLLRDDRLSKPKFEWSIRPYVPRGGSATAALFAAFSSVVATTSGGSVPSPLVQSFASFAPTTLEITVGVGKRTYWSGAPDALLGGELWRLFTPSLLHSGLLHLAVCVVAIWLVAQRLECQQGFRRTAVIMAACSATANVLQYLVDVPAWVGLSPVILGSLLYSWTYDLMRGPYPIAQGRRAAVIVLVWTAFEAAGVAPLGWAHAGGAAVGVILALAVSLVDGRRVAAVS